MMRLRRLLPALLMTATLPTSGWAEMTVEDRAEFRAEVRAYLLENPGILSEMVALLEARQRDATAALDSERIAAQADALFDDGFSFVGGNPDGSVTVVEFLDYQCSYCRRAHPEIARLVAEDGDIRLIVKEWPVLGPASDLAARTALALGITAGPAAYAAFHDQLMRLDAPITEATVTATLTAVGADPADVRAAMDGPEVERRLEATRTLARELGIQGTPTFVFGDRMLRGYAPIEAMQALLDDLRKPD